MPRVARTATGAIFSISLMKPWASSAVCGSAGSLSTLKTGAMLRILRHRSETRSGLQSN